MTKIKVMIPTQESNDIQKGYFNLYMCFLTSKPTSGGKGLSLSIKENSSIKEREDQKITICANTAQNSAFGVIVHR